MAAVYHPTATTRGPLMSTHNYRPFVRRLIRDERGNCFLYGCVTLVILALLGGLIVFLSIRYVARELREKYTEEAPVELPTVDLPQSEIDALVERINQYAEDLRDGKPLEPITVTQDDINALLQNHPDLKEMYGDHMYVTLGDSKITAQMSLPLEWLPLFRNRYFNGTATFDVGFLGGKFQIYLDTASVKGEDVPRDQLRPYRRENFGDVWEENQDARSLIDKIESVTVKESGVTVVPVNKASAALPETETESENATEPESESGTDSSTEPETDTPPAAA
jgi:hypothetical protein